MSASNAPSAQQTCPILLINLKRSSDRLAAATATLTQGGLSFERIEAVDGSALPAEEFTRLAPHPGLAFFKSLTAGEVGCALSHRRALERIDAEAWPCALVLEDDFALRDELTQDGGASLRSLLSVLTSMAANGPDVINLFGQRPRGAIVRTLGKHGHLMRSASPPVGNVALFWTLRGARKFLRVPPPFLRPVDVDRKHWWERDLDACWISPPPCLEERALGTQSTIGARRSAGSTARFRKLLYRSKFAAASQWNYVHTYGVAAWLAAQRRTPRAEQAVREP